MNERRNLLFVAVKHVKDNESIEVQMLKAYLETNDYIWHKNKRQELIAITCSKIKEYYKA